MMRNPVLVFILLEILFYEYEAEESKTAATSPESNITSLKPEEISYEMKSSEGSASDEEPLLRRHLDNATSADLALKWDKWCQYQPYKGECSGKITRFYYDTVVQSCQIFIYSGCNSGRNNFETEAECEKYCKGKIADVELTRDILCFLQADFGTCGGSAKRYYYDMDSEQCQKFTYSGCGGNLNRFETKAACMSACRNKKNV